jgi:hypothetical protein
MFSFSAGQDSAKGSGTGLNKGQHHQRGNIRKAFSA